MNSVQHALLDLSLNVLERGAGMTEWSFTLKCEDGSEVIVHVAVALGDGAQRLANLIAKGHKDGSLNQLTEAIDYKMPNG